MLGQYHVLEELGRNELGPLHLARLEGPKGFQRWAVIRIIDAETARRISIDLYARARTGAQLIHPNVAALFEIGERDDGGIWVASEYVHGAPISEILERSAMARTPVPWEVAAQITLDAAEGLHASSDRTLKSKIAPGTIAPWRMIATFDGKTKLVGVFEPRGAKEPERISYTAPEDLFGESVSASADVFTLGTILWELCSGRRLFHGASDEETAAMIEAHRVQRIGSWVRGFPQSMEEVIRKALASRPDARYANPRELSRAISSAYVAERRVVGAEDVGKYVRQLCGDLAADMEDRLARASDVTEVYRRGGRGTLPSIDFTTPELGKAVDPGAFDEEIQTEEMRTAKLIPDLSDDTLTEERPIPGRDVLPSTADTPSLGADTVRDLAEASAPTPHKGSPSSTPPPPILAPPSRTPQPRAMLSVRTPGVLPPVRAPTPSRPPPAPTPPPAKKERPRPPRDSFEHIGGDSEVFFARSEDGARLVRKPPARTPVVTPSDSVVIEPEALKDDPAMAPTPAVGIPSSQPPPSMGQPPLPPIPAPPSPFMRPPMPSGPPRGTMSSTVERAGRGFVFAALGATIGVAAFLLIVSIAPGPKPPPTVVTATTSAPTVTTTATVPITTTTTTTPIATHVPIPTMNVSSLPPVRTGTRPHITHNVPQPPPAAGKGFLTVMCSPACDEVLVDGKSLGPSPVFKASLSAGVHKLLLRGDVEKTMDVTITADETTLVKPPMK